MINIIIVYFPQTNRINQLLVQHCRVNETVEHRLEFFAIGEGGVHLV